MAEVTTGLLKGMEGHIGGLTFYERGGKTFVRQSHIRQPRRLSRKQLALREQLAHNNILWRKLKATRHIYFEGVMDAYRCFMSANTQSPIVYLTKSQLANNMSLLLPGMAVSIGPVTPINYQSDEVDGKPALLTDIDHNDIHKGTYLLYVLKQEVLHWQNNDEHAQLHISVVPVTSDHPIEVPHIGTACFVHVPSTILTSRQFSSDSLALVGDMFSDPMLGFALVHVIDGHASTQRIITRCTYYEHFTTEEALQAAAKSYKGLTGE